MDSNPLQIFSFENNPVRTLVRDGEPWFVATDVAAALGYRMASDMTRWLDDDEKGVHSVRTLGGEQDLAIINEAGLYSAILKSRRPEAKAFKRWITHEVLPAIRKTGSYGTAPAVDPMTVLNDPAAMRGLLLTYTEKVLALESRVAEQAPKVDVYERLIGATGSLCMRDAAKVLQVRPIDLRNLMLAKRWIYGRPGHDGWLAYQERIQQGLLVHKVDPVTRPDGTEKIVEQVRVPAKGLAKLAQLIAVGGVQQVAA